MKKKKKKCVNELLFIDAAIINNTKYFSGKLLRCWQTQ